MNTLVKEYLGALWKNWIVFVTGTALAALPAVYSFATGQSVTRPWGWAILALTFLFGSFGAWRTERERAIAAEDNHAAMLRERKELSPRIVKVRRLNERSKEQFGLHVTLAIPGPATSLNDDWTLTATRGHLMVAKVKARMHSGSGKRARLESGTQASLDVVFKYADAFTKEVADSYDVALVVAVTDIHGNRIQYDLSEPA